MKILVTGAGGMVGSHMIEILKSQGYKVIRFWNNEVRDNIEGVCEVIKRNL